MATSSELRRGATAGRVLGACLLLLALVGIAPAGAAERVALLIGNADYRLPEMALDNPVNDVRAVGRVLEGLGFEVRRIEDADHATVSAALAALADAPRRPAIGLVYFAGHGLQINGENYLIGTDLPELTPQAVVRHSITLSGIRAALVDLGSRQSMVVLDACRTVPDMRASAAASAAEAEAGLAVTPRPYPGFLIAYATDPGNLADDGLGENSAFTAAFLRHVDTAGLDVRLMFGRIRQDVLLSTEGRQVPWVEESLLEPLVLNPAPEAGDEARDDVTLWRRVEAADDREAQRAALAAYLEAYPDGLFADVAETRLAAIAAVPEAGAAGGFPLDGLSAEETRSLAAALRVLGYLPREGDSLAATTRAEEIDLALAGYARARSLSVGSVRLGTVLSDAVGESMTFGAYLAERIRTDLKSLKAIMRLRRLADEALAEIERHADRSPDTAALLAKARANRQRIEQARRTVLDRLDVTREQYRRLATATGVHFLERLDGPPEARRSRGAGTADGTPARFAEDQRRFLDHARMVAQPETRGTMAWLTDFQPAAQ